MRFRVSLLLAAALLLAGREGLQAEEGPSPFHRGPVALWQGFSLSWTYNHRLNRLGNYVANEPASEGTEVSSVQTAATGLGDDIGLFEGHFSVVDAPGLLWAAKRIDFHARARRGEATFLTATVSVPDPRPERRLRALAFLNGFDLRASGRSDKLQTLELAVGEPFRSGSAGELQAILTAALNLDCRSLECSKLQSEYDYDLTVQVLLVVVPEELSQVTELPVADAYSWDRHVQLERPPVDATAQGIGGGAYRAAVLGLRTLSVQLAQDSWFIDWATALTPGRYDPDTGRLPFETRLLFREWRAGMHRHSADRFDSRFSFRKAGSAAAACTVLMLQLVSGCTDTRAAAGELSWRGRNRTPDQPEATRTVTIDVGPGCSVVGEKAAAQP